nr:metalloregulator ArsR/SmtB family transcription factor [Phenylobacterium sp.]
MERDAAIDALGALAHPGRIEAFRLLVRAGPEGMAQGEAARVLGVAVSTLSTNLGILAGAGLVRARREGRSVIYTAAYERMRDLLGFLMEDCCAGRPEICGSMTPPSGADCCVLAPVS